MIWSENIGHSDSVSVDCCSPEWVQSSSQICDSQSCESQPLKKTKSPFCGRSVCMFVSVCGLLFDFGIDIKGLFPVFAFQGTIVLVFN